MFRMARAMLGVLIALIVVDMGMLVITILALLGAGSSDDREVVQKAVMDFPPSGRPVQTGMIILVSCHSIHTNPGLIKQVVGG